MSPLNDRSGRHQAYVLPPEDLAAWPAFARARADYERLLAHHAASGKQIAALEEDRVRAEADDRRRAAGILRKRPDAPHPVWPKRDGVDQAIAAERDRREALAGALAEAERDLEALVEEHRGAWLQEAEAEQEEARLALDAAVSAWVEARRGYRTRAGLAEWLREFPRQATFRTLPDGGHMPPLTAPHGHPPTAAEVLEALREDAAAPEPAQGPSPHVSPVGTSWPALGPWSPGGALAA